MITLIIVLSAPFILWVIISTILYTSKEYEYNTIKKGKILRERTMTNYNFWALFFNIKDGHFKESIERFLKRDWKPKTEIDKEIAKEEKEIAELERQKEKINKLSELKFRKERLFKEVHKEELWECTSCGEEFETLRDYGRHVSEAHHS